MNNKISFLIICHKNISQVERLIQRLISDNSYIFVHFDKQFENKLIAKNISKIIKKHKNTYSTKKRLHGELNKRSIIDITMLLIKRAHEIEKKNNVHFSYYYLVSGQDYPLTDINIITNTLLKSYPNQYIDCEPEKSKKFLSYIYNGYYRKRLLGFVIDKNQKYLPSYWLCRLLYKLKKEGKTDYEKLKTYKIELYTGSAWWCLTDIVIEKILHEYNSHKPYIKVLLNSRTPEESFIQTIVMTCSDLDANKLRPFLDGLNNSLTYPFFADETHPFKNHPYNMTLQKTKEILNTNKYFFARKYDIHDEESLKALDYLDTI